ncbi:uncharacterized protein KQ657_000139 [Scheffersomyces spartinae]|uniref:U1 small nuclear ribonucleoprotein component SNU71 n=1 Tax=Scheffersomyces spartinae TaxID=45513 RepID=A0A9P8AKN7_9ASCO|nr:uncharacterized protein KQ657_000139 [Scheffersomyces spartinae]KAG7196127.1 hypothetical protein KQ657_000139 [Scheffersomyces spartinae]
MSYIIRPEENETQKEREKKLASLSEAKLPSSVAKLKIDLSRVNLKVIIREWLDNELETLLPEDDDIMKSYVEELLESQTDALSGGELHLQVAEFLGEEEAVTFIINLWKVLESALNEKDGIPQVIKDKREVKARTQSKLTTTSKYDVSPKEPKRTNYNRSKYNTNSNSNSDRNNKSSTRKPRPDDSKRSYDHERYRSDRERESENSRYRQSNVGSTYRSRSNKH